MDNDKLRNDLANKEKKLLFEKIQHQEEEAKALELQRKRDKARYGAVSVTSGDIDNDKRDRARYGATRIRENSDEEDNHVYLKDKAKQGIRNTLDQSQGKIQEIKQGAIKGVVGSMMGPLAPLYFMADEIFHVTEKISEIKPLSILSTALKNKFPSKSIDSDLKTPENSEHSTKTSEENITSTENTENTENIKNKYTETITSKEDRVLERDKEQKNYFQQIISLLQNLVKSTDSSKVENVKQSDSIISTINNSSTKIDKSLSSRVEEPLKTMEQHQNMKEAREIPDASVIQTATQTVVPKKGFFSKVKDLKDKLSPKEEGKKGFFGSIWDTGKSLLGYGAAGAAGAGATGGILGGVRGAISGAGSAIAGSAAMPVIGALGAGAIGYGAGTLLNKGITHLNKGKSIGESLYDSLHPKKVDESQISNLKDLHSSDKLETAVSKIDEKIFEEKGSFFGADEKKIKELEDRKAKYKNLIEMSKEGTWKSPPIPESKPSESIDNYRGSFNKLKDEKRIKLETEINYKKYSTDPKDKEEVSNKEKELKDLKDKDLSKENMIPLMESKLKEKKERLEKTKGNLWYTSNDKMSMEADSKDISSLESELARVKETKESNTPRDIKSSITKPIKEYDSLFQTLKESKLKKLQEQKDEIVKSPEKFSAKEYNDEIEKKNQEIQTLKEQDLTKDNLIPLLEQKIKDKKEELKELSDKSDELEKKKLKEEIEELEKDLRKSNTLKPESFTVKSIGTTATGMPLPGQKSGGETSSSVKKYSTTFESLKAEKIRKIEEKMDAVRKSEDPNSKESLDILASGKEEIQKLRKQKVSKESLVPMLEEKISSKKELLAQYQASGDTKGIEHTTQEISELENKLSGVKSTKEGRIKGTSPSSVAPEGLGGLSAKYESGTKGADTVSSGKGDKGGVSYGTHQMSSEGGSGSTVGKFAAQNSHAEEFKGLRPGTPEFSAKWKEVAAKDPNFGNEQHEYIKKTHYDPVVASLKEQGVDVEHMSDSAKDVVWSRAVQHGAGGAEGMFKNALGKDATGISDEDFIKKTYEESGKVNPNGTMKYFGKNSKDVQDSVSKRLNVDEKNDALVNLKKEQQEMLAKKDKSTSDEREQAQLDISLSQDRRPLSDQKSSNYLSTIDKEIQPPVSTQSTQPITLADNSYTLPDKSISGAFASPSIDAMNSWSPVDTSMTDFGSIGAASSIESSEQEGTPIPILKDFENKKQSENQRVSKEYLKNISETQSRQRPEAPTRSLNTSVKSVTQDTDPFDAGISLLSSGILG